VLAEAGFPVTASDILTAPVIAAAYLQDRYPGARCLLQLRLAPGQIGDVLDAEAEARRAGYGAVPARQAPRQPGNELSPSRSTRQR